MTTIDPQVTVLMAVRNGSPFLVTAIDSILHQTYSDFCFLIVDDASQDNTPEIVRSYEDERIQLICLDKNVGQTAALNVGLHQATTPWIARMDADDYSAPTRLEEQMQALDEDRSLACVGAFAWTFRDDPMIVDEVISTPLLYEDIKAVVANSPIIHGTLVVNRAALLDVGSYNDRYRFSADLDMYDRLLASYSGANIPKQLLGIRRHGGQASRTLIAVDELIEIFSRKLERPNYSPSDASTIRASLSRSYVDRARHMTGRWRLAQAMTALFRGLRLSPKAFIWHFFKVFTIYTVSETGRARVKRLYTRLRPHRIRTA